MSFRPTPWSLASLLAALAMLGPFSIDMYLPAFGAIGQDLRASPLAMQQTLSAYLFAFALMMLWHGALSDALGRRPVILANLVIYAVGTLACAIAGNIESLWLARAAQGISAGAGIVVGRAIIRDHYHGADAQRVMSRITLMFSIAPVLAPVLGGAILAAAGWRALFWVLLAMVGGLFAWSLRALPESLPKEARQSLHPRALGRNYRTVLLRGDFLLLALVPASNFCGFFVYIASAPVFVVELLGRSAQGFAWLFLPMIGGIIIGATLSGRLAGRLSPQRTVRLAYLLMAAGVVLNFGVSWLFPGALPWTVLPIMIFTAGTSLAQPSLTLLLLDLFPAVRGMTSSLQGFLQFALSGVVAGTVAPVVSHSLLTLAATMGAFATASIGLWSLYERRNRHPSSPVIQDP